MYVLKNYVYTEVRTISLNMRYGVFPRINIKELIMKMSQKLKMERKVDKSEPKTANKKAMVAHDKKESKKMESTEEKVTKMMAKKKK